MAAFVVSSAAATLAGDRVGARAAFSGRAVSVVPPARASTSLRMGYGDYSYVTDLTKGHVQQYYVDKFRRASDFTRGVPASDDDAMLGRTAKGSVAVPADGIPQLPDGPLARSPDAPADPRVAEADGSVWSWDASYVDPALSAVEDTNDEAVADAAFAAFRGSMAGPRGAALAASRKALDATVARLSGTISEKSLLTLDGQLDVEYSRLQKIKVHPTLSPTGQPQTEIPGTPYLGSVGALDFQKTPGGVPSTTAVVTTNSGVGAFWKAPEEPPPTYKRPLGAATPERIYNASPNAGQLSAAATSSDIVVRE
ncbi:hypothetical protein MMPV_001837 [Pyropia vietnamensis]